MWNALFSARDRKSIGVTDLALVQAGFVSASEEFNTPYWPIVELEFSGGGTALGAIMDYDEFLLRQGLINPLPHV